MKIISRHFLLPAIALLCATACKKDKDKLSKTELLTQQSWQYAALGIDLDLDGNIDDPLPRDVCETDDIITFHANGTGTFDQGSDLCYPQDPQTQEFTWQLQNDTHLTYGGATHTIISITETELRLFTEELVGDEVVRVILAFRH